VGIIYVLNALRYTLEENGGKTVDKGIGYTQCNCTDSENGSNLENICLLLYYKGKL